MKFIDIALNDLKLSSRNKIQILLLVLMPILMISLLGNALKPAFESGKNIKKVTAAYINNDKGVIGNSFDNYLKKYASSYIDLIPLSGDEAENYISSGKGDIAIIVPEGLSKNYTNGNDTSISVLSSGKDQIKDSIVKSVIDSYISYLNTNNNFIKSYKNYSTVLSDEEISKHISELTAKYSSDYISTPIEKKSAATSFDYFAASMLLFFLLYSGIGAGSSILSDRAEKIYMRINSFPVTDNQYLLGKILGNAVISITQALSVILFAKFAFNVSWGNIYGIMATVLLIMFISSATGILFTSIVNSSKSISSSLSILFWIIAFLGGGFSPIPSLEPLGKYNFYTWALNSISSFMSGGSFRDSSSYLILLLIMSIVLWTLGLVLYKRRASYE